MIIGGSVWGQTVYIWSQYADSTKDPDGIYTWDEKINKTNSIITNNNEFSIWKSVNKESEWIDLTDTPTMTSADNLYFSGEVTAAVKLISDITVNDLIFAYEQTASHKVTSGDYPVTIDLNGYTLTCKNLILNNEGRFPANVIITDSSAGTKGTFIVNNNFDFNDTKKHHITINNDVTMKINGTVTGATEKTQGNVTIDGNGKLELNGEVSNGESVVVKTPVTGTHANEVSTNIVWNGSTDNKWETGANWTPANPDFSKAISIHIPANQEVIAESSVTLPEKCVITSDGNIKLTFNDTATIGEIRLAGTCSLTTSKTTSIKVLTLGGSSKVNIIAGTTAIDSINSATGCSYKIDGTLSLKQNLSPNVDGYTIDTTSTGTIETNGEIIVTKIFNVPNISFKANKLTASQPITCKSISLTGDYDGNNGSNIECSGALTIGGGASFRGDLTVGSISVTGGTSFCGACSTVTSTNNQTYGDTVQLLRTESAVKLVSTNGGTIHFTKDVRNWNGASTTPHSIIIGDSTNPTNIEFNSTVGGANTYRLGNITVTGNVIFRGNVSAESISVEGTTAVGKATTTITTTGKQEYSGTVKINSNGDTQKDHSFIAGTDGVIFNSTVEKYDDSAKPNLIIGSSTNATKATFKGNITGLYNITIYGTTTFDSASAVNVETEQNQVYADIIQKSELKLYSNDTTAGTVTIGNITTDIEKDITIGTGTTKATSLIIKGNIGTAAKPVKALKVYGTTTIGGSSASSIYTKNSQTYTKALTLEKDLSLYTNNNIVYFQSSLYTLAKTLTLNSSAEFTSDNTFTNLVIGDENQTSDYIITFKTADSTQVFTALTSNGTQTHPVTLTGPSTWKATVPANATFKYTLVENSTSTSYLGLTQSEATVRDKKWVTNQVYSTVNWFSLSYVWQGTTTAWETPSNWKYAGGNTASEYPDSTSGNTEILIPNNCSAYPVIENDKEYKIKTLEIDSDASITLSNGNLTLTSTTPPLTNYGTIIFTDTGRIYNNATTPALIMDNTNGTVQYGTGTDTSSGTITNYGDTDYNKLVIASGTWTIEASGNNIKADSITVKSNGKIIMENTAEIAAPCTNNGTIEITAGTETSTTQVAIWSDFINEGTIAQKKDSILWISGTSSKVEDSGRWTFENNSKISLNIQGNNFSFSNKSEEAAGNKYVFEIYKNTNKSITLSGFNAENPMQIISYTDTITDADQNSTSAQILLNNVKFLNDTTFNNKIASGTTGNIEFAKTSTFNKAFTTTAGALSFKGNVLLNKGITISATTADNQEKDILIDTGITVTAKGDFKITKGKLLLKGTVNCNNGTPANSADDVAFTAQSISVQGNASITAKAITIGGSITPDVTDIRDLELIATNGNISIGSSTNPNTVEIGTDALKFHNITLSTITNDITFEGNSNIKASNQVSVTGKNITFSGATIADALIVNAQQSVKLQPGSGDSDVTPKLSLRANSLTVNGVNGSTPAITYSGTIDLSAGDADFTINRAVTINGNTHFNIGGNFVLASTGSITPDTAGSHTVQITAKTGKNIQLNNNVATAAKKFSQVVFNSPIVFNEAHAINALTTDFATGCSDITVTDTSKPHYTISDSLIVESTITFPDDAVFVVPGNFTNKSAPSFPKKLEIKGNFTDEGTWTATSVPDIYLTGTQNQSFNGKTNSTYQAVTINQANNTTASVEFKDTTGFAITNLTVTKSSNVIIDTNLKIGTADSVTDFTNSTCVTTVTKTGSLKAKNVTLTAVNISNLIETSEEQTITGTITVSENSELKGAKLTLPTAVNLNNAASNYTLTLSSANIKSANINGATTFAPDVIMPVANTTFTGSPVFKKTLKGNSTTKNNLTITGKTEFDSDVSDFAALEISGTVKFNNGTSQSVTTTGKQTFSNNIEIKKLAALNASEILLNRSAEKQTISGTNASLTLNTAKLTVSQNSEISVPVTLAKSVEIANTDSKLITFKAATGTAAYNITNTGSITFDGISVSSPVINNGTISCIGNVTFKEEYNSSATNTFNAGSGTVTFNKNIDFSKTRFNNQGGTVVLEPTGASLTINGSSKFYNFICDQSSAEKTEQKIIYFTKETTQTVDGKLTLKGKQNQLLKLRSTNDNNNWNIEAKSHEVSYVDLMDSNNTAANGYEQILYAASSKDSNNNINWSFPLQTYNWKGGAAGNENNWFTKENWEPASVPGIGANVIIPNDLDSYPVLNANVNLNGSHGVIPYNGTITIEAGSDTKVQAILDIADKNLTAGTITNNGLVRLEGISGQTISGTMVNGTDSTVEYYSAADGKTENLLWDGSSDEGNQYENLLITNTTESSQTTLLDVYKTLIINGTTTLSAPVSVGTTASINSATELKGKAEVTGTTTINTIGNVTLNNAQNKFIGNVILTSGGTVTLQAGSQFTLAENAECNTLNINSQVMLSGNVTTTGNQTYSGAISLGNRNIEISATGTTSTINFNSTLRGNSSPTDGNLTLTASNITFGGEVSAIAALKVNGKTTVKTTSISTSGNQTYTDEVAIGKQNTSFTSVVGKVIKFENTVTGTLENLTIQTADAEFHNDVSNFKDISCEGKTTFAKTASEQIINSSGTQTYTDAVSKSENTDLKFDNEDLLWFKNTLTGSDENLTITGDVQFDSDVSDFTELKIRGTVKFNNGTSQSVTTTGKQTYSNDIEIKKLAALNTSEILLNKSAEKQTISGTDASLTLKTEKLTVSQNSEISVPVTLAKAVEITNTDSKVITFKAATGTPAYNITNTGCITFDGISVNSPVVNNGIISCTGNVTFKEEYKPSTDNTFNAGSGTVTFNKNIDFSKTTFNAQNGTVVLEPADSETIRLTGSGSQSYNTLQIKGNAVFTSSNTFVNLEAIDLENKTIIFPAGDTKVQNITGTLKLTGKADEDGKRLILRSSSAASTDMNDCFFINFTGTVNEEDPYSPLIQNVDVKNGYNVTGEPSGHTYLTIRASEDSGNNYFWNFAGLEYIWTGKADTNWFNKSNWNRNSVPAMGTDVIIPADYESAQISNWPALSKADFPAGTHKVSVGNKAQDNNSLEGTITVAEGAVFDLCDESLAAGTITNNGLVRLEGISGQKISGTMVNGTDSTVEYYNDTTVSFVWDGNASHTGHQFNRLLITGKTDVSDAANVTDTTEINTSKDVSLTGANIFGNGLNITEGGNVRLNSANGANGFVLTQTADSPLTTLTVDSKVDLASDLTASEKQTYKGPVVLDVPLNIKAPELIFNSTIDSKTGSEALIVNGAVTFNGNMGDNSAPTKLTVDGTSLINASSIKTSTEQIYNDAVTIDESTTLTGPTITFNSTVDSKDKNETLTVAGNAVFNDTVGSSAKPVSLTVNGETLINTAAITTADSQTYKKTVTVDESTNLTGSTITFNSTVDAKDKDETLTVTGNVIFNGDVGTTATLTDLTVTETSLINTAEIITSESQTYEKAVTVDKNTTLSAPTITFKSTVDAKDKNETLTVAGNAIFNGDVGTTATLTDLTITETSLINTEEIITSNSQVYEKAVTIDESTTLTSSEITFNSTVDSKDGDETLTISGNVTFNEKVGSLSTPAELTVNGNTTTTTSNITTEGSQNYNGKLTAVNTLTLTENSDTGKITFTAEVTGAPLFIDGNTYFADGNNITSDYVKIINTKKRTWTSETKANLATDLYVDCSTNTINLNGNLTATNIYMYKGNVNIGEGCTIESTKNFVVWGANYSAKDKRYSSSNTRFEYYKAEPFAYSINPENASTTFGELKGNITVNGNFYLNGTDLPSLKLNIPDNSKSNPVLNITDKTTETQWGLPYAISFNSQISGVTVDGGWLTAATAQDNTDKTGNTNIQFQVPRIVNVRTVYDDVIYIAFNMPLENSNNEINTNLKEGSKLSEGGLWYNNKSYRFAPVAYTDADCSKPLDETKDLTQIDENGFYSFYIRTIHEADDDIGNPYTYWNTDADGKNAYSVSGTTAADSTDRNGYHHNITVDLSLLEGLFTAADGHTMSNNYGINYEADGITQAEAYSDTEDYCEPVLIAVYIGQENHEDNPSAQEHYDAHNFIELRYSEPVNIGDETTTLKAEVGNINIKTTSTLGNITGNGTISNSTKEGLDIEGLVKFATGKLNAANKNDSSSPHALYRTFTTKAGGTAEIQTHRIRLSIAGFVDGEIDSHKNWVGYIDYAEAPETGDIVNAIANPNILDLKNNILDVSSNPNHKNNNAFKLNAGIPNETLNPIYGTWDTLPPVFSTLIKAKTGQSKDEYEILPTGNGTVIDKIELHILDGDYSEENKYFVFSHGWSNKLASADPVSNYLYQLIPNFQAADRFGGSRAFDNTAARTSGGIRYSSVVNQQSAFKFTDKTSGAPNMSFNSIKTGATANYFSGTNDDAYPIPLTDDNVYISLGIPNSNFNYETTFKLSYDNTNSYITDLAGNRLQSHNNLKSIDRTPPDYSLTLAPIGTNELYIIFTKTLETTDVKIMDDMGKYHSRDSLFDVLPEIIKFGTINGGWQEDSNMKVVSAQEFKPFTVLENANKDKEFTGVKLTLENPVTLEDVTTKYMRIEFPAGMSETGTDSFTNLIGSRVTYIQSNEGTTYMQMYKAHPISDFAVNAINPEYAYDPDYTADDRTYIMRTPSNEDDTGSWAVHSWGKNQGNFGTLPYNEPVNIIADRVTADQTYTMYLANNPDALSVSTQFNSDFDDSKRIWLPEISGNSPFEPLADALNTKFETLTETSDIDFDDAETPTRTEYKISKDDITKFNWHAGDQIKFLFSLDGQTIMHTPSNSNDGKSYTGIYSPIFALRTESLTMPDVTTLDLWSFRLKDYTYQRGGVSIFNNVINVAKAEKTIIKVNMPKDGKLKVIVMTLDGNVIDYLENSNNATSGEHVYYWNGTNRNHNMVARGMYFIRVIGDGLDETRKVMCVNEK